MLVQTLLHFLFQFQKTGKENQILLPLEVVVFWGVFPHIFLKMTIALKTIQIPTCYEVKSTPYSFRDNNENSTVEQEGCSGDFRSEF